MANNYKEEFNFMFERWWFLCAYQDDSYSFRIRGDRYNKYYSCRIFDDLLTTIPHDQYQMEYSYDCEHNGNGAIVAVATVKLTRKAGYVLK